MSSLSSRSFLCLAMFTLSLLDLSSTLEAAPPTNSATGEIWMTDYEAAMKQAKAENKSVLIHFHATWCGPCRQMEAGVFSSPHFKDKLRSSLVGVKVDSDRRPDLVATYRIDSLPADVLLDAGGKEISRSVGSVALGEYLVFLGRAIPPTLPSIAKSASRQVAPKISSGNPGGTIPIEKPSTGPSLESPEISRPEIPASPIRPTGLNLPTVKQPNPVAPVTSGQENPSLSSPSVTTTPPAVVQSKTPSPQAAAPTKTVVISLKLVPVQVNQTDSPDDR